MAKLIFVATTVLYLMCIVTAKQSRNILTEKIRQGEEVDPSNCFFDGQRTCFSCKNAALCVSTNDGMTAYNEHCYEDEICNIATDEVAATCVVNPENDEPGAACFCNPSFAEPRTEPDPYTEFAYLYCNYGLTYYIRCYNNYVYDKELETCAPTSPPCSNAGIFGFPNDCDFYYICGSTGGNGLVQKCSNGTYFDPNVGSCQTIPDTNISCKDESGDPITGLIPSVQYCSIFYLCDQGTLENAQTCAEGEIFSVDDQTCIPDDGSCVDINYCF